MTSTGRPLIFGMAIEAGSVAAPARPRGAVLLLGYAPWAVHAAQPVRSM